MGYTVVHSLEQIKESDSRYQIGKGKTEELSRLVKNLDVKKIIFDNSMKTTQIYNLTKLIGVEVIDRFQLILEIFAQRATTSEAKLQIQLARLRYELPRAKEKVRLAKLSEQPGFLGLGRYQVDLYYANIQRQITHIRQKLRSIRGERHLRRVHRFELGFPIISLAGYTNAGKSTLFNALVEETVPVDPGLFTTLSTTTRMVELFRKKALLTDTVGFIDRLPLTLIEAFHSTLEETIFSDLLLLIVDISEDPEEIKRKLSCCFDTLKRVGAAGIPTVTALNKIDLLSESEVNQRFELLKDIAPNPVPISALHKTRLPMLKNAMRDHLKNYIQANLSLPVTDEAMSFLSWLYNRADVSAVRYEGDVIKVAFEATNWIANKAKGYTELVGGVFSLCAR